MIGAGKSKMRLMLCEEETKKQTESIRSVLAKTIHQVCTGSVGRKWDPSSPQGKILGALSWCTSSIKKCIIIDFIPNESRVFDYFLVTGLIELPKQLHLTISNSDVCFVVFIVVEILFFAVYSLILMLF